MTAISFNSPLSWLGILFFMAPLAGGLYYEQQFFLFLISLIVIFLAGSIFTRPVNRWSWHPLDLGGLAFVLAYLLSLPGAADYREALVGFFRAVAYFLFYWLVTRHGGSVSRLKSLLWALYLSGITSVALSFLVASGWVVMDTVYEEGILHTTLHYKNAGALFLAVTGLMGFFLHSGATGLKVRMGLAAGQYWLLIGLLGTMSRGVWLLYPLALAALLAGWPAPKRRKALGLFFTSAVAALAIQNVAYISFNNGQPFLAWLWLASGAAITLVLTYGLAKMPTLPSFSGRVRLLAIPTMLFLGAGLLWLNAGSGIFARWQEFSLNSHSVQERLYLYKDAWKIISAHPVFGAGAWGWDSLYLNIQSYAYYAENVHNDYLQLMVETGMVGLAAFLLTWGLFIYYLKKTLRETTGETRRLLWTAGTGAVLIGVHSMLDFNLSFSSQALLLWLFFALPAALDKCNPFKVNPRAAKVSLTAIVLLLTLMVGLLGSFYVGSRLFAQGVEALDQGDVVTARKFFRRAIALDPYKTNTAISLAQVNLALVEGRDGAALDEALYYARKTVSLRPSEPLGHFVLATALFRRGEADQGISELEAYVRSQPNLLTAYEELAKGYNQVGLFFLAKGNLDKAAYYFKKTLTVPELLSERLKGLEPGALKLWSAEPRLDSSTEIPHQVAEAANRLAQLGN
ncbi:MAG: O-antigen ligase family protein [Thermincolia bacterium]